MIALRVSFTRGVSHHSCLLKGVWRCLLQDVNVMGHATSFFRVWRWLCGKTKRGRMKKNDAMQECERHCERDG